MADRNCCLFTYGASGSGKTYTIMGGSGEAAGLLPRSLESIFSTLKDKLYQKQVLYFLLKTLTKLSRTGYSTKWFSVHRTSEYFRRKKVESSQG